MVTAYQNGAKYIVVFNSPGKNPPTAEYGILTLNHLKAIKEFWNYLTKVPKVPEYPANTAYVLPRDYGFGFRSPNDTIWGLWKADELSSLIWNDANRLIAENGQDIDIVYETEINDEPLRLLPYGQLIFWNGTRIEQ